MGPWSNRQAICGLALRARSPFAPLAGSSSSPGWVVTSLSLASSTALRPPSLTTRLVASAALLILLRHSRPGTQAGMSSEAADEQQKQRQQQQQQPEERLPKNIIGRGRQHTRHSCCPMSACLARCRRLLRQQLHPHEQHTLNRQQQRRQHQHEHCMRLHLPGVPFQHASTTRPSSASLPALPSKAYTPRPPCPAAHRRPDSSRGKSTWQEKRSRLSGAFRSIGLQRRAAPSIT